MNGSVVDPGEGGGGNEKDFDSPKKEETCLLVTKRVIAVSLILAILASAETVRLLTGSQYGEKHNNLAFRNTTNLTNTV